MGLKGLKYVEISPGESSSTLSSIACDLTRLASKVAPLLGGEEHVQEEIAHGPKEDENLLLHLMLASSYASQCVS